MRRCLSAASRGHGTALPADFGDVNSCPENAGVKEQAERYGASGCSRPCSRTCSQTQPRKARERSGLPATMESSGLTRRARPSVAHEGKREPNIIRLTFSHLMGGRARDRPGCATDAHADEPGGSNCAGRPAAAGRDAVPLAPPAAVPTGAGEPGQPFPGRAGTQGRQPDRPHGRRGRPGSVGRSRSDARTEALPLLDRAADRLRGYGALLRQPECAALLPLDAQFSELRRRAAYGPPQEAARKSPSCEPRAPPLPRDQFCRARSRTGDLRAMLKSGRLVTLTGMGGCGKTRLALEVAAALEADGWGDVRLVELAGLGDPDLLPQALATGAGRGGAERRHCYRGADRPPPRRADFGPAGQLRAPAGRLCATWSAPYFGPAPPFPSWRPAGSR